LNVDNHSIGPSEQIVDSDTSGLNILAIGKQKITWQQVVLMIAASMSIIIIMLILIFIGERAIHIFPRIEADWMYDPEVKYPFFSKFLFGTSWLIKSHEYGIIPSVLSTVMVVTIAMVIAIPVGIGCSFYLAEIAPTKIRKAMKPTIELLASIPSIVYGFIGLQTIVWFIEKVIGYPRGRNAFSAGVLLSIMVLPTIISIADDAITSVPQSFREGSYALGATKWQTMRKVVFPAAISGITAAVILAFGRAIGETMAVYLLAGGSTTIPIPFYNIFYPCDPLTSKIARELGEAGWTETEYSALFGVAAILFITTFLINLAGDLIIRRYAKRLKGA
jgi:phosphate ABC transporter permease protein PstC